MSENIYYHAILFMTAPLSVQDSKGSTQVTVEVAGKPFPLSLKRNMRAIIETHPPGEGELDLLLWPRTDKEGLLGNGTQLGVFKPVGEIKRERGLHALGELVRVDRDNALIQIQIHPNPDQGGLRKPFKLPLIASMELMERLPELGNGLEVWADLKPKTGRMVVREIRAVPLPPKRVLHENPKTA